MHTKTNLKNHLRQIVIPALVGVVFLGSVVVVSAQSSPEITTTTDQAIVDLNQQINEKQQQIDSLQLQSDRYQQQLDQNKQRQASLQSDIEGISVAIDQSQTQLTLTQKQVESLQLQIQKVQQEISVKEKTISTGQENLADLIRRQYEADQVSQIEIILQEQSFSGFFARVQTLHAISASLQDNLTKVVDAKKTLNISREDLLTKQSDLDAKRHVLEATQTGLTQQQESKQTLLEVTKQEEAKFAQLLDTVQTQQAQYEQSVSDLKSKIDSGTTGTVEKPGELSWPVSPIKGISCGFHCSLYPFEKSVGPHSGMDIPTPQGTPVASAMSGKVTRVRNYGWISYTNQKGQDVKIPDLNFVWVCNEDNSFCTSYLHLSSISVSVGDQVKRGQIIGLSGGTPYTAGAGLYTTGAHVHFGVYVDGIAVDPQKYLPSA